MYGDIYCDMDGVLVDFYGGVHALTGKHIATVQGAEKLEVIKRVFDSGPEFWANLLPTHDFAVLWGHIKKYHPYILTAMPHKHGNRKQVLSSNTERYAHDGKWSWVTKHLGIPYDHFHVVDRERKKDYATSVKNGHVVSNILIDDTASNIQEWRLNRGIAIFHHDALHTIEELKKLGY